MKIIDPITSWDQITLWQFQEMTRLLFVNEGEDITDRVLSILYNLSEVQCLLLTPIEREFLLGSYYMLLNKPVPFEPTKYITANGKLYYVEWDPNKLTSISRKALLDHFPKRRGYNLCDSLQYIVARVVRPVNKNALGFSIKRKHNRDHLETYMEDLREAKIIYIKPIVDYYQFLSWGVSSNKTIEQNLRLISQYCVSNDDMQYQVQMFHNIFNNPKVKI